MTLFDAFLIALAALLTLFAFAAAWHPRVRSGLVWLAAGTVWLLIVERIWG